MDTEIMIRNLKKVEDDHKGDKVFTGQLNISDMARDVRKRLEELKPYEDTGITMENIIEMKARNTYEDAIITGENHAIGCKVGVCPKCNTVLKSYMKFCYECGQKLWWEEL